MPADAPGGRLMVLASGLRQFGAACEDIGGELAAEATAPVAGQTPAWASCVSTLKSAAGSAGADLCSVASRIGARGAQYSRAGLLYTDTEESNAGAFWGLRR